MGQRLDIALTIPEYRAKALQAAPMDFEPENEAEFYHALKEPWWRLSHLYKIMIKTEDDDEDSDDEDSFLVKTFRPNDAQLELLGSYHFRNIIEKARQLGFTTLICILFLDTALFSSNLRAGIIAQTRPISEKLFRDKVKFAYENLPPQLLERFPLKRESADELLFEHNNSSLWVSTSMRGSMLHMLHVSEFGKICAESPKKAKEIVTGAFPAVPLRGVIFIESTAEGKVGEFYKMVMRALKLKRDNVKLKLKQYKLFFFPWYSDPGYTVDPEGITITNEDHDYFDQIEALKNVTLTLGQRAWYVATRDEDFSGDEMLMFQEYPSTEEEPFQVSVKGAYYSKQLAVAKKQGRMPDVLPVAPGVPCWTFWDIGASDGTAIWVVQYINGQFRVINFFEMWDEPYSVAANWLLGLGLVFERHYLPHDAKHRRQGETKNKTPLEMLQDLLKGHKFEVVPVIDHVIWGIQQTRDIFPLLAFDATTCAKGIDHLMLYKKKWNKNQEVYEDAPDKSGGHSEAADALRQLGQAYANKQINVNYRKNKTKRKRRNWKTA